MIILDTTESTSKFAEVPVPGSEGVMSRRERDLFGTPVAVTNNVTKVDGGSMPVFTPSNERVLLHTCFRPKVASTSERLTFRVHMSPSTSVVSSQSMLTTAMVSATTSVFTQMSVSETHQETSTADRTVSIIWANPTTSMMSHNKYLVFSYRIE